MKHPKVSVIIPVYNTEDTIRVSLQSARVQTLSDIEIICVDNNSTDKSVEIIEELQALDYRIKLFCEKKQGSGPTRNLGLEKARGDFIFFLDPDDSIFNNATLEKLYDIAKAGNLQVVGGSAHIVDQLTGKKQIGEGGFYFKKDGYVEFKDYQFDWGFWRFLYNRKFLQDNNINFPAYLRGQDTVFFVKAMTTAKRFYAVKDPTYKYNYSFSNKKHSPETYADYEKANKEVIKIAQKHKLGKLEVTARSHRIPLVSVIVPIYNVEETLADCVDSIVAQTHRNLEIILVDDKTPDKSGKIADDYARKDERIKVIHKPKNEGLNMARATGFKASTGEYVTFVDSDDMLAKNCVETAMRALLKNQTDFVRFGARNFKEKSDFDNVPQDLTVRKERILDNKKDLYRTQFVGFPDLSMLMCVWGAVYSRKQVEKIDWKSCNYRVYEDNIWTLRFLEHANSGTYLNYDGYLYRNDPTISNVLSKSFTGNQINGKKVGYLEFLDIQIEEFKIYNKRYNIGANKQIDNFAAKQWTYRLNQLVNGDAVDLENNREYLQRALHWVFREHSRLQQDLARKQEYINRLEQNTASFLGIKRSAKLLVGNIRRRLIS